MNSQVWKAALWLVAASGAMLPAASPQVAILDSDQYTREFFRRHYPACGAPGFYLGADEYKRYLMGWIYVLDQMPVGYQVLKDADITETNLSQFKLLILPNTASMSDDQQKAIQKWVIRGGRLLATFGSGYKDITADPRELDQLKVQKGGTTGLHQLWHDPMTKVFGSNPVNNGQGTDVRITQYTGPTACLSGLLANDLLPYGAESNLLVHRPENFHGALGFVVLKGVEVKHPSPAIMLERMAHGLVVYYAFAPEYLVSKEFNLPVTPSCPDGQNWSGRSTQGRALMQCTINFLLNY